MELHWLLHIDGGLAVVEDAPTVEGDIGEGWVCNRILVAIWGLPSSFPDTDSELNAQKRLKTKRQRESYNLIPSVWESLRLEVPETG